MAVRRLSQVGDCVAFALLVCGSMALLHACLDAPRKWMEGERERERGCGRGVPDDIPHEITDAPC